MNYGKIAAENGMKFMGISYDRKDYCLPDFLEDQLHAAVENAARQAYEELKEKCLKVRVDMRRKIKILETEDETGLHISLIIPEGGLE